MSEIFDFYSPCMSVLPVPMYVYCVCASFPSSPGKGTGFPGSRVTEASELPCWSLSTAIGSRNRTWPLYQAANALSCSTVHPAPESRACKSTRWVTEIKQLLRLLPIGKLLFSKISWVPIPASNASGVIPLCTVRKVPVVLIFCPLGGELLTRLFRIINEQFDSS